MEGNQVEIRWASRVRQADIRRLYETDARGIYDEDLLNEVGWGLYARCDSFMAAVEALHGRARCHGCRGVIPHDKNPETILKCPACGWEVSWRAYHRSFQHRQLSGGDEVLELFRDYCARFPDAREPREKMRLIDGLIHGFHWNLRTGPRRTTGVNLIEGDYHEVVAFLDRLTYGENSTPELAQTRREWRDSIRYTAITWDDERMRLPSEADDTGL